MQPPFETEKDLEQPNVIVEECVAIQCFPVLTRTDDPAKLSCVYGKKNKQQYTRDFGRREVGTTGRIGRPEPTTGNITVTLSLEFLGYAQGKSIELGSLGGRFFFKTAKKTSVMYFKMPD